MSKATYNTFEKKAFLYLEDATTWIWRLPDSNETTQTVSDLKYPLFRRSGLKFKCCASFFQSKAKGKG